MSELTPCNYCTLLRTKARAKKEGKVVTVIADTTTSLGGLNVYVHPKNVKIKELAPIARETYGGVWFMALTDHCVC